MARRGSRAIVAAALLAPAIVTGPAPTATAAASVEVERYSTAVTGWGWYFTATPETIGEYLGANGMRIVDLEVVSVSPLRFSVSMVRNTGTYARSWWWYYDQTASSLLDKLGGRRLIDVERYSINGKTRFAGVMVGNGGSAFRNYKWYLNQSPSSIASKLSAFGGRIVDIDRRSTGRYDVVMIKNSGAEAKAWWYYYRVTPSYLAKLLAKHKARLIDIEPDGSGRFTVVLARRGSAYWWYHPSTTAAGVSAMANQYGMRIYDLERYKVNGATRYAVLLINNLNTVATKVRQVMWPAARGGTFGFRFKDVGGPVRASLQAHAVHEPASSLKVLHHLHAVRQVQSGAASLAENVTWHVHPSYPSDADDVGTSDYERDRYVCAYTANGQAITSEPRSDDLDVLLRMMMEQGDNRTTDGIRNRFTKDAINATAQNVVGMPDTELNHRNGCPNSPWVPNRTTLNDMGTLYEKVADGTLLTPASRNVFYDRMYNTKSRFFVGVPWPTGLKGMIDQEAAKLGKPASAATAVYAGIRMATRGGAYVRLCGSGSCKIWRANGGRIAIPFKQGGATVLREHVFGMFVDAASVSCPSSATPSDCSQLKDIANAFKYAFLEMARPRVAAALATW